MQIYTNLVQREALSTSLHKLQITFTQIPLSFYHNPPMNGNSQEHRMGHESHLEVEVRACDFFVSLGQTKGHISCKWDQ